jgi:hypothetical protein
MLNLADLFMLLMVLAGPLSGVGAAHAHKAGILSLVVFGLIGLAIGVSVAVMSSKLAYSILRSKQLPAGVGLLFYSLVPLAGLLVVVFVPILLAGIFL